MPCAADILVGRAATRGRQRQHLAEPTPRALLEADLQLPCPPAAIPAESLKGGTAALRWRHKQRHHGGSPRTAPQSTGGPGSAVVGAGVGFGTTPRFPAIRTLAPTPERLAADSDVTSSFSPRDPPAMPLPHVAQRCDPELDARLESAVMAAVGGRRSQSLLRSAAGKGQPGAFCFFFASEAALDSQTPTAVAFMPQDRLERLSGPQATVSVPTRRSAPVAAVLMTAGGTYTRNFAINAPPGMPRWRRKRVAVDRPSPGVANPTASPSPTRRPSPQHELINKCEERRAEQVQSLAAVPGPGTYAVRDARRPELCSSAPFPAKLSSAFVSPSPLRPRLAGGWCPGGGDERSQWLQLRGSSPKERSRLVLLRPLPEDPTRPLSYVAVRGMTDVRTRNAKIL
eukprot:TRINITY_DN14358_c0_g1_i1.p1 TRINITY_DN14358_c0_g1~~TRINITY_DN14358_c0_g1_i1.p1  ORF type:complete len:415 (+),score=132.41 TRINITY_DN14358_c0_g1_i1:50-1246(+)